MQSEHDGILTLPTGLQEETGYVQMCAGIRLEDEGHQAVNSEMVEGGPRSVFGLRSTGAS